MITIEVIVEAGRQTLNEQSSPEIILNEWISKKDEIIIFKADGGEGNIKVVIKSGEDNYQLLRFFTIGGKWQVSKDYTGQTKEQITKLI